MRIISLVPSITEALFDLGASAIVGRTKFCVHPQDKVRYVPVIGGTKNLNIEKIAALKPDIIIANREENEKEQVEQLEENFKVLLTQISTLEDNYYLLKTLGALLHKEEVAQRFNTKINEIFDGVRRRETISCAYLIWQKPYMSVGRDTFIHEILTQLGFDNVFRDTTRYPEVSINHLQQARYVFLSSEPYPFNEQHVTEIQQQLPNSKVVLVDGEAFSWYGTRLAKCETYFKSLIEQCP